MGEPARLDVMQSLLLCHAVQLLRKNAAAVQGATRLIRQAIRRCRQRHNAHMVHCCCQQLHRPNLVQC